jgi:hypothetical protein
VPPAGYFDPYFANMQQGLGTQFGQQLESGFMNMQQHFQGHLNTMQQQFSRICGHRVSGIWAVCS